MFDVKLIEAFVQVVRAGSMTRAEALTGTPKATLSRQVVRLETALQLQLMRRDSRRLVLTEAGRSLYAHGEHLLADIEARVETARTEAQAKTDGLAGELTVLTETVLSTTFMCHVLHRFGELHPNVHCRLDITDRATSPAVDVVDCYVGMRPPHHPNLIERTLGSLGFGLYASPSYLRRHGIPEHPRELQTHRCVLLDPSDDAAPRLLYGPGGSVEVTPVANMAGNDHWVVKTFCIDGAGVALLPDFFAAPELRAGTLVRVLSEWQPEPSRVVCAYQRQRYAGRKVRAFVDLTIEAFAQIGGHHFYVGAQPV